MPVASQRFRQRKLSTRLPLQILRESDLDDSNLDNEQQNAAKVETGVEKHEETEHHLQAAINASHAAAVGGKVTDVYIPTPETAASEVPYERLYQLKFEQPATYIRFSSTVEDCCGCPYNLTDEDDEWLKQFNEKVASRRSLGMQCSDDHFEEAMNFFEETAKVKQPFSGVGDPPPIVPWDEMQEALDLDENLEEPVRLFAADVYIHWSARRAKNGNTALQPALRLKVIETSTDVDDNDPYVCFRRREVRQVRKTRGRDAQSVEKLRKLRRELEDARQLIALVRQREMAKKEQLAIDKQLFEQRMAMRKVKRSLPEQYREGDEELLINQKPVKKKPSITVPTATPTSGKLPTTSRADGKASSESDLVLLDDLKAEKAREIEREIAVKKQQHTKWNENFVDRTRAPLDSLPNDHEFVSSFRPASTEYLPTPPASVSGGQSPDRTDADPNAIDHSPAPAAVVRFTSPPRDDLPTAQGPPSFRLRKGRLNRLWLDRRGMNLGDMSTVDPVVAERFRYDRDNDDEEDSWPTYVVDPDDAAGMRYRAAISGSHPAHTQAVSARRNQIDVAAAGGQPALVNPKS